MVDFAYMAAKDEHGDLRVALEEALARIAELEATLARVRAVCETEVEEDGMRGGDWHTVPVDAVREALGED